MGSSAVVWSPPAVRRHWSWGAALLVVSVGAVAFAGVDLAAATTARAGRTPSGAVSTLTRASFASAPVVPDSVPPAAISAPGPSPVPGPEVASGELDPSIWFALIASLAAVALMLLGSGLVAFLYQTRQSKLSAEARWVPPGW